MRSIDADALIMALRLEYPMMPMFKENQKEWEIKTDGYRKAEEVIRNAPTIEPKRGEWIPCTERLPSGEDAVLVSTCAFDAIYDVVFMMAKDVERFYECGYVNAWMPSPEPWRSER